MKITKQRALSRTPCVPAFCTWTVITPDGGTGVCVGEVHCHAGRLTPQCAQGEAATEEKKNGHDSARRLKSVWGHTLPRVGGITGLRLRHPTSLDFRSLFLLSLFTSSVCVCFRGCI